MIGLVVVNYNDYKNTIQFINSLKEYKIIDKIVIVDNNSSDESYEKIKKITNEKIILIKNDSNKGYGSGINLGAKYLIEQGIKKIIVSNTDIIINSEEDIKKLLSYIKNDIALVGPNVLEKGNKNRGWKIPTCMQDIILNLPYIHRYLRKKILFYKDEHYQKEYSIVDTVSGCFFIVNAEILKKVDYFDENMFLYYEENVLGTKLKKQGYKAIIVNDINVIHNHSVTIDNSLNRIKKFKALKKSQKYFHKNYSKSSIFGIIGLDITNGFMILVLYIVMFFKGGKK